jgi:hypothetical protein
LTCDIVSYHMMFVALNISTTGVTSGAEIPYPYLRSLPVFNGVHVLCVVFVDQCFFLLSSLKTDGDLGCSVRVSSSCSTSGAHHVTIERQKDRQYNGQKRTKEKSTDLQKLHIKQQSTRDHHLFLVKFVLLDL